MHMCVYRVCVFLSISEYQREGGEKTETKNDKQRKCKQLVNLAKRCRKFLVRCLQLLYKSEPTGKK